MSKSAFQWPPPSDRQDVPVEEEESVADNPELLEQSYGSRSSVVNKTNSAGIAQASRVATQRGMGELEQSMRQKIYDSKSDDSDESGDEPSSHPTVTINLPKKKKSHSGNTDYITDMLAETRRLYEVISGMKDENGRLSRKNAEYDKTIQFLKLDNVTNTTKLTSIEEELRKTKFDISKYKTQLIAFNSFNAEMDDYFTQIDPLLKTLVSYNSIINKNKGDDKQLCIILGQITAYENDVLKFISRLDIRYKFMQNKNLHSYLSFQNQKLLSDINNCKKTVNKHMVSNGNDIAVKGFFSIFAVIGLIAFLFIKVF